MTWFADKPSQPDQTAARQLLRLHSGELSEAERAAFETWRAQSDDHSQAFMRVQAIWRDLAALRSVPEIRAMRAAALAVVPRSRRNIVLAAAAAALALVVLAALLVPIQRVPELIAAMRPGRDTARDPQTFATAIGERSTIVLQDGSVLTLDTDSAARVAYSAAERAVFLLRGQAMFEVAKNQPTPFVVHARDRRVVATGTAFDVRLDNSDVEVTLVEGHVIVDQLIAGRAVVDQVSPSTALASVRTELQPGERLVARPDAGTTVSVTDVGHVTSWRSGRLVFLDESLADATGEVNRYTKIQVRLADKALESLRVNGVFRTGQPLQFAQALAQIYPVTVSESDDGGIIIARKKRT